MVLRRTEGGEHCKNEGEVTPTEIFARAGLCVVGAQSNRRRDATFGLGGVKREARFGGGSHAEH